MILASQNVQIAEEKDFVREKISVIFFVNTSQKIHRNRVVPQRTVFQNTAFSKGICRILPFVSTKAVLVRKIDEV